MILLAMLLAMQAAPPPPDVPEDIIVNARKIEQLKRLRMTTKLDRRTGTMRCVFNRRSGDPALDNAVCNAVLACVPEVRTADEMQQCIAPAMDSLVAKGMS